MAKPTKGRGNIGNHASMISFENRGQLTGSLSYRSAAASATCPTRASILSIRACVDPVPTLLPAAGRRWPSSVFSSCPRLAACCRLPCSPSTHELTSQSSAPVFTKLELSASPGRVEVVVVASPEQRKRSRFSGRFSPRVRLRHRKVSHQRVSS